MEMFDRQIRFLGIDCQKIIQELTVAMVGLGGLGSVIVVLLARLGVQRLILIDYDRAEESNLNRLAGATWSDTQKKKFKVDISAEYVKKINPAIEVITLSKSVLDSDIVEYLKQADSIFGGLDNQSTRDFLNKFSVQYMTPYFDCGTGIQVDDNQRIVHAGGQFRAVIPGMGCLHCINGIDLDQAQQELFPEEERQIAIRRGYITGADVKAPAVATLNGIMANLAVTQFLAWATDFKLIRRYLYYDFMQDMVIPCDFPRDSNCFTCSSAGSFAMGEIGFPLPAELLIYEKTETTINKEEVTMENIVTTSNEAIESFIQNAKEQNYPISGSETKRWILIKEIVLGKAFNNSHADLMIRFPEDNHSPIILLPETIQLKAGHQLCGLFLETELDMPGWRRLCCEMFASVGDDVFEFVLLVCGMLSQPDLCGLMGCSKKEFLSALSEEPENSLEEDMGRDKCNEK